MTIRRLKAEVTGGAVFGVVPVRVTLAPTPDAAWWIWFGFAPMALFCYRDGDAVVLQTKPADVEAAFGALDARIAYANDQANELARARAEGARQLEKYRQEGQRGVEEYRKAQEGAVQAVAEKLLRI